MPESPAEAASMEGKTCVVTGATSGIGAVTAEALARAGARVVILGRDAGRGEATVRQIKDVVRGSNVESVVADLSLQSEVRRVAAELQERCPRLDVLVNNAGAMFERRSETAEGVEKTWALNHLAYFLLTNLLLDRLRASAPARVVSVASDAHRFARKGINWDDPEGRVRYGAFGAYARSKLANILFTRELARRLEGSGVTANCLHPGFVWTRFFEDKGAIGWLFKQAARVLSMSAQEGAKTSIYLATAREVDNVSGRYFEKCRPVATALAAQDDEAAARLWRLSAERVGIPFTP